MVINLSVNIMNVSPNSSYKRTRLHVLMTQNSITILQIVAGTCAVGAVGCLPVTWKKLAVKFHQVPMFGTSSDIIYPLPVHIGGVVLN
jgi:hypothetical protein